MSFRDRLHPTVSNAEIEVFKALSRLNLTTGMVTQKPIVLKLTIPDFTWQEKKKAVYLDGSQVHRKRQERDEEIDNLLELQGWNILRITYTAPMSQITLEKTIQQIKQFLNGEKHT